MKLSATGRIYGRSRTDDGRRRAWPIIIAGYLVLGSAAGLAGGLVSRDTPAGPADRSRPLSAAEAGRLATMRLYNFQDGRAGVRGTLGHHGEQLRLAGWVDWQRPLAYLSVTGPTPSHVDGLVQALPGVIAVRPGRIPAAPVTASAAAPTAASAPAREQDPSFWERPPAEPPVDGWRVRPFTEPDELPLDTTLRLLFTLAAKGVDAADGLARGGGRWLRADRIDGTPVDVLLGPAAPPLGATAPPLGATAPPLGATAPPPGTGPTPGSSARATARPSPAASARHTTVRYWLASDARLHRLEAVVGANLPLRLDFDRADRRELGAIELLGGRAVSPRRVTAAEAELLARLPWRGRATGGGMVTLSLPGHNGDVATAVGWLDWLAGVAYLALRDGRTPAEQVLIRADAAGITMLTGVERGLDRSPPLPPPRGAWTRAWWAQRPPGDLDLLLTEVLALSGPRWPDADLLSRTATWLRADLLGRVRVAVYEIPKPDEDEVPTGSRRLRYWVDSSGALRRLQVRAASGAFGRLDVSIGAPIPYLPPIRD